MTERLNWNELANTRIGDVQPPKVIPGGHYVGVITGAPKVDELGKNKNLAATFPVQLQEPLDDVDSEAFAESDGFNRNGYRVTFWITPDALYRFTDFGKQLGASDELSVVELAEFIAASGEPIVFEVDSGENEQTGKSYVNLNNPIPLSLFQERTAAA